MTRAAGPGVLLGDRYRIVSELARGGMASVWTAEDTLLGRRVAVKTLHPDLAIDDAICERFAREAIAAATLNHPNIVTTYDTGVDDDISFIVMELVGGTNVRKLLNERGRLSVAEAVCIARDVAAALAVAHAHDIVHRDIKPANVLVQPSGRAKVTDFGIAKAGDDLGDLTRTGTVVGTARYLSPEQLNGDPVGARSDLYTLGLLIHEMLTGSIPFSGDTELAAAVARLSKDPVPLRDLRPDVPPVLADLVSRLLARDPADRIATATEVQTRLERMLGSTLLNARPPGAAVRPPAGPNDRSGTGAARSQPAPGTKGASGALRPAGAAVAGPRVAGGSAPTGTRPTSGKPAPGRSTPGRPGQAGRPRTDNRPAARPQARPASTVNVARSVALAVLAVAVLLAGAAAGYVVARGGSSSGTSTPVVRSAADFDPVGRDGEHPEETRFAIDGDPTTGWSTEHYATSALGGKGGVGLQLGLASDSTVRRVVVDTTEGAWSAQVYTADGPGSTLANWGPAVASVTNSGTRAVFALPRGTHGSAVLLWITRVPASSGRLVVTEVRVS